jgi:hypothetical protein
MFVKRALKRDQSIPIGISVTLHLDCECGNKVTIPSTPDSEQLVKTCACGIEYDQTGWILKRPSTTEAP